MTETYVLTEKIVGETYFSKQPIRYVTYTTPSPQDKDWSLTLQIDKHGLVHPTYTYINDDVAKQEYPIFNRLASARNWAPAEPLSCTHTNTRIVGLSAITKRLAYRCEDCGRIVDAPSRLTHTTGARYEETTE